MILDATAGTPPEDRTLYYWAADGNEAAARPPDEKESPMFSQNTPSSRSTRRNSRNSVTSSVT